MAFDDAVAPDSLTFALREALTGKYEVERELGRGGAAIVFLAHDLRHARKVAVKVLTPGAFGANGADRFLHEIRIAARLTHPHILGVHDSGQSGDLLYYVMPYVEGETLRNLLARRGVLPVAEAVRLIREIAGALAYAHAHGVIHRDLKPENVLLAGGHAVIADFGIAKALASATSDRSDPGMTATGVAIGTPAYMAPEQAVGDKTIDHRADLYALGVVAYEILCGVHPFGTRSAQAYVVAHLTDSPANIDTRRGDIPPALAALVMQLLAKDPAERPQGAQQVVDAIDAMTSGLAPSPPLPRRRNIAVAVLAMIVIAAAFAAWRWRPASRGDTVTIPTDVIRSVAVIPFANNSDSKDDEYFSDGMTDELAHSLRQIPGLSIAGRTASYAFKGKSAPAQEIGRSLDVGAIIGGSLRRSGDRLRLTAQLVSTRDGKVLWDSVYESRSRDVFAVQDEFTQAIAAALMGSLGDRTAATQRVEAVRGTTNEEAYDLFLRGQYQYLARGEPNVAQSIESFRAAIQKDPQFARAYGALSNAYAVLRVYVPDPRDSLAALARTTALRAIALDSTIADAQLALAGVYDQDLQFAEAERHYRRGIALDPTNGDAHLSFGFGQMMIGHNDVAERELREAVRLDPLLKSARASLALSLALQRRFPEAIAESRRLIAVDSTFPLGYSVLALAQVMKGEADSALQTIARSERYSSPPPWQGNYKLFALAAAGRWSEVERMRAETQRRVGNASDGEVAFADLLLGDREPLVQLLTTRQGQRRWYAAVGFGCHPFLDPLWSDARFTDAMRTIGVEPCKLARQWPFTRR